MRELILNRIEEIAKYETTRFNPQSARWSNIFLTDNRIHISKVNLSELNDEELLMAFERVVRQSQKQM